MNFSRRLALGYASMFAVIGGGTEFSFASVAKKARVALLSVAHAGPAMAQLFRTPLIHRDETGGMPHAATLSLRSTDSAWVAIASLDDSAFADAATKYKMRGYRLRRVNAFQTRAGMRYAAIWQLSPGFDQRERHAMSRAQFEQASVRSAAQGYRLSHVDGSATHDGARFAAIWERGTGAAQHSFAALTADGYKSKLAELGAQGFRPRQISGYADGGQSRFAAIFEKASTIAWDADHAMTAAAFEKKTAVMSARGYSLFDASGHVAGGQPVFSGVWEKA